MDFVTSALMITGHGHWTCHVVRNADCVHLLHAMSKEEKILLHLSVLLNSKW